MIKSFVAYVHPIVNTRYTTAVSPYPWPREEINARYGPHSTLRSITLKAINNDITVDHVRRIIVKVLKVTFRNVSISVKSSLVIVRIRKEFQNHVTITL